MLTKGSVLREVGRASGSEVVLIERGKEALCREAGRMSWSGKGSKAQVT